MGKYSLHVLRTNDNSRTIRFIVFFSFVLFGETTIYAEDKELSIVKNDIESLFAKDGEKYWISYDYTFSDTLFVPRNSVLIFNGGSLSGPVVFDNTMLTGMVDLRGASLAGSIKNKVFDASWFCAMDGVTDDAPKINEIINVCDSIFFPKGIYRLISTYNASDILEEEYLPSVTSHIGISKSNIHLIGEEGTLFTTEEKLGIISIISQPHRIENSIRDISIEGITFNVKNDGKNYNGMIHTIKIMGVNGLIIKDCNFNDYWGDAICLSHYGDDSQTGERSLNQNIIITQNFIQGGSHHNNRNGISVISGKNVVIKNNHLINTSRSDKPGGIDVEPNNSAYTIENIQIENNVLEDIQGSGGAICVVVFDGGPAHGISIIGNTIRNCNNGLLLYVKTEGTTDNFIIKNNYIDSDTNAYRFTGCGSSENWSICGNTFKRPGNQNIPGEIKVKNLVIQKNKKGVMPLYVWARSLLDM